MLILQILYIFIVYVIVGNIVDELVSFVFQGNVALLYRDIEHSKMYMPTFDLCIYVHKYMYVYSNITKKKK